jgi:RNA polymerase sigma factor (sigma-70 family)
VAVPPARRPKLLPTPLLRLVSDERLVEQVRAGSEHAFEVLVIRHRRRLLVFCSQMLRSQDEAEDVVQQTFLAAYCDLLRSHKPIAPRPWLLAIARNHCLSILRAQREQAVDAVPLVADSLFAEVDRREDLRGLLLDLGRLPDDQRAALLLTELSGVPQREIAEMLGCRPERVKALVFQARASLAAERAARETPCYEIRAQLATVRGSALRRAVLRRHVRSCVGCREFQAKMRLQRRQLGALLPAGPGLGLGLPGFLSGSGAAGIGGLTLKAGALGGGLVTRVLVGAALSSGGAAAGVTAIAHSAAEPMVRPAEAVARAEAAVRPATGAVRPAPYEELVADRVVSRHTGVADVTDRAEGLQPDVRTPRPAVGGGVPELATTPPELITLLDRAPESEQPAEATGGEVSEADQFAAGEPAETVEEPGQEPPSAPPAPPAPPSPASSDGSGHVPPAATGGAPAATGGEPAMTSGEPAATGAEPAATGGEPAATGGEPAATGGSPHPKGPAGQGLPPSTGGTGPPAKLPRGAGRRPPEVVPHANGAKPPGDAATSPHPGKEPPRHGPVDDPAAHAKPDLSGTAKPASPAAQDAHHGPPPGGATSGRSAQPTGGTRPPGKRP